MTKPQTTNTTTVPAKRSAKALELMADRLHVDPKKLYETLKNTVFKSARDEPPITDDELLALVVISNRYTLDPILRQIYAFRGRTGGIVPVVGVDGWINIVNREDNFDGVQFEDEIGGDGKPISCTAIFYLKHRSHPCRVTERFAECVRNTNQWRDMPFRMIRHKAYIQCARVAFGISGIYDEDEARDIAGLAPGTTVDVGPASPAFDGPDDDLPYEEPKTLPAATTQASYPAASTVPAKEPELMPRQAPEPPPTAPAQQTQQAAKDRKNGVITDLTGYAAEVGATPDHILAYLKERNIADPDAQSLLEIPLTKLLRVATDWPTIKDTVANMSL